VLGHTNDPQVEQDDMNTMLDYLSLPAQQLLDYLITNTYHPQRPSVHSWVAYLDNPVSNIIFSPHNETAITYRMDYRSGLPAILELIEMQYISVDELGDMLWRFHLRSERCRPSQRTTTSPETGSHILSRQ
jgi:hypothetical protein